MEILIDIIPSTTPISKSTYQMSLTELGKVKNQLHELKTHDLMRPSTLSCGCNNAFDRKGWR